MDGRSFRVRIGDFSVRLWEMNFAGSTFQYISTDHLSRPYSEHYTNNPFHSTGLMTGRNVFADHLKVSDNALTGSIKNDAVQELDVLSGQKLKELYDIVSGRDDELDELLNLLG